MSGHDTLTDNASVKVASMPSTRKKFAVRPGRSMMDWVRLTNCGQNLRGNHPSGVSITNEELGKHNTKYDAWMVLRGQVYNITHFLDFHPGGVDILLKSAGKDGTWMFDKYHSWVNIESILAPCRVGVYSP
eukprot:CFRG6045T1